MGTNITPFTHDQTRGDLANVANANQSGYDYRMPEEQELMTNAEIHAFGVEIVCKQLAKDGWAIHSADVESDLRTSPQIVASKDGNAAFFIVRTGLYPGRGRFDEGQKVFNDLVRHAQAHGAECYFASVGIANSSAATEEEMSVPAKGVAYNVQFEGLIKMELPPEGA